MRYANALRGLACLVFAAGCSDGVAPDGSTEQSAQASASAAPPSSSDPLSAAEERWRRSSRLHRIAARVPGFSGIGHDLRDGQVVLVYTSDVPARGQLDQLRTAAAAELGLTMQPRLQQAEATFEELDRMKWRATRRLVGVDGVSIVLVDALESKVVIGVHDVAAGERAGSRLSSLPNAARLTRVEVMGRATPFRQAPTLESYVRPIAGGLRVAAGNPPGFQATCSLGFMVRTLPWNISAFLMASHCTERLLAEDATDMYQPTQWNAIGSAVHDPAAQTCTIDDGGAMLSLVSGAPRTVRCRSSDVALIAPEEGVLINPRIARTTIGPQDRFVSNLTINPGSPIQVTGARYDVQNLWGQYIHKVGQTTGWTRALMTDPCANVFYDANNMLLCQVVVANNNVTAGNGDSGAPVFLHSGSGATALGILSGGISGRVQWWFSPLANIEAELGQLRYAW